MSLQPDPHQNLYIIQDNCFETGTSTRYIKGNFLGKGGFARCYELICETTKDVAAVKIIQKSSLVKQRSKQKLYSEIKIHQGLSHPHIVQFLHNFEDTNNVYIVLELCTNKTLNDLLKKKRRLNEGEVRYYMLQVLQALQYLHAKQMIHRDLKLGNLFLNESMQIKMGDFGLAAQMEFQGEMRKTICGTPNYIAPEVLTSKGHSFEADIWSFGIILYTLVYGRPPFQSKDVKETYKKIKIAEFSFPETVNVSPGFKHLVKSTLQKDPYRRPTFAELRKFQFFKEGGLTRQPSISFKMQNSSSYTRQERELSDNGKLYTNYDLGLSKDTTRQKSQEKFMRTDRASSMSKYFRNSTRAQSQRILKDSNLSTSKSVSKKMVKNPEERDVSVRKWIDYSSKYGIGYSLSNGSYGVYFNDSTKVVSFDDKTFHYVEKIGKEETITAYGFDGYPPAIKKKVSLYMHFRGYLKLQDQNSGSSKENELVYVRRWFRSKHAMIFRLSNKSVQVVFMEQTALLIRSANKSVLYINKNKERVQCAMKEIGSSNNRELIKRFEYTKDVLNEMAANLDTRKEQH